MSTRNRFVGLALAVGLISGCSVLPNIGGIGNSDPYAITTNRDSYNRGNTGEATIRNISGESLEYNLCPRRLERRTNRDWTTAYEWPTAGGVCTTDLRRIGRGEALNALFEIPVGIPTGTYRVVFTQLLGEGSRQLSADDAATPSFEVR